MAAFTLPVSRVIDSRTPLSWEEALALVQSVAAAGMALPDSGPASDTFEEFLLQEDGSVIVEDRRHPSLSLSALALLLGQLLPDSLSSPAIRPPAGLDDVIGQALGLIDAPPFASVSELHNRLARFEQQSRKQLLAGVIWRIRTNTSMDTNRRDDQAAHAPEPAGARVDGSPWFLTTSHAGGGPGDIERRRPSVRTDALRRLLREEDRQNYEAMVAARQAAAAEAESRRDATAPTPRTVHRRRAAPPADVLRRLIRDADERYYALVRRSGSRRFAERLLRRPWHAVMLVAGLGVVSGGIAEVIHVGEPTEGPLAPGSAAAQVTTAGTAIVPATVPPSVSAPAEPAQPAVNAAGENEPRPKPGASTPPAPTTPKSTTGRDKDGKRGGRKTAMMDGPTSRERVAQVPLLNGARSEADRTPSSAAVRIARHEVPRPVETVSDTDREQGAVPRFFVSVARRLGGIFQRTPKEAPAAAKPRAERQRVDAAEAGGNTR